MYSEECYLGCPNGIEKLRTLNNKLNAKVVEQVNDTQELVMINNFARESNETQFKRCLQERISDIASWRWVLEDLASRLQEAIGTLEYEHNALRVVVERVQDELNGQCQETKPGTLCPFTDAVEDAILQEHKFLRDQKNKFDNLIPELEKQIKSMQNTKRRIDVDILHKQQALSVDEACGNMSLRSLTKTETGKKKKKRGSPISRWENRCAFLKRSGLRALSSAIVTRQQVRGARVHLSIAALAYAARVDSALRRRLHSNKIKFQDLNWQKDEAMRDFKSLDEELRTTEQNLLETMEQERLIEARLADRSQRPGKELIKDEVERKLKDELGRLKSFSRHLRNNLDSITCLQNHLTVSMAKTDCYIEDILSIISLDEQRLQSRLGDNPECTCSKTAPYPSESKTDHSFPPSVNSSNRLTIIKEEDEEDDYPFEQ